VANTVRQVYGISLHLQDLQLNRLNLTKINFNRPIATRVLRTRRTPDKWTRPRARRKPQRPFRISTSIRFVYCPSNYHLIHTTPMLCRTSALSRQIISNNFSIKTLCAAVRSSCTSAAIKQYVQSHKIHGSDSELLSGEGWPALYYAARRNSPELVTILLQTGVDARTFKTSFSIPPLAYIIIYGQHKAIDASEVLKLLLAAGYDPTTIPMDM
jgi:hypothetical protein